jgi:dipeptidase E
MRILLASGGMGTPDRLAHLFAALRANFGAARRLLFVPFALADHDAYTAQVEASWAAGYALDGWHRAGDPLAALEEAEGVYVGGGNTFRLLAALEQRGLLEPLQRRVRAGLPYFGVSAGANLACPTIQTTNDMPIVRPQSFRALGLVPFQINAHYFFGRTFVQRDGGELEEHRGETRDERLAEYHEENHRPVLALWEGALVRGQEGGFELISGHARWFTRGAEPLELAAPAAVPPVP